MRSSLHTATIVVLIAAMSTSARAQEKLAMLHGAGGQSCGTYVQDYDAYRPFTDANASGSIALRASAKFWQYEAWIQGYLYGIDTWSTGTIRDYDRAGMQLWIYNYCQKNPLDLVVNAAFALWRELGGKNPK